jgi:hypothetical protein
MYFLSVGENNKKAWDNWRDVFRKTLENYKSTHGYLIALADCHF